MDLSSCLLGILDMQILNCLLLHHFFISVHLSQHSNHLVTFFTLASNPFYFYFSTFVHVNNFRLLFLGIWIKTALLCLSKRMYCILTENSSWMISQHLHISFPVWYFWLTETRIEELFAFYSSIGRWIFLKFLWSVVLYKVIFDKWHINTPRAQPPVEVSGGVALQNGQLDEVVHT